MGHRHSMKSPTPTKIKNTNLVNKEMDCQSCRPPDEIPSCSSSRQGWRRRFRSAGIIANQNPQWKEILATRGLLATDHVILNHGQVTWTTPELAPPSPNYHITPTGGRFSARQI
ncbi:hypothetical protein TNCV_1268351 [Trichonephila clavipes]|nr:hypothetical protein TNCV_1268351 [Trichonephila clavipes]